MTSRSICVSYRCDLCDFETSRQSGKQTPGSVSMANNLSKFVRHLLPLFQFYTYTVLAFVVNYVVRSKPVVPWVDVYHCSSEFMLQGLSKGWNKPTAPVTGTCFMLLTLCMLIILIIFIYHRMAARKKINEINR